MHILYGNYLLYILYKHNFSIKYLQVHLRGVQY